MVELLSFLKQEDKNSISGLGALTNVSVIFQSNEYFFTVTLPNRGVATPSQIEMRFEENTTYEEKAQLSHEKTQLLDPKRQLSSETEDWELKYFHDVVVKNIEDSFRGKTLANIEELFIRYRYVYSFNRSNVAELFGITENRASVILKICVEKGIIAKQRNGVYGFVKQ